MSSLWVPASELEGFEVFRALFGIAFGLGIFYFVIALTGHR